MNAGLKDEVVSPRNKKRRSIDRSSDFVNIDKSTKEERDLSYSKSKSSSPTKKRIKDNTQLDRKLTTLKSNKKKLTWKKEFIEIVDVHSYKKFNMQNTHDDPPFLKEKVKCGCLIY